MRGSHSGQCFVEVQPNPAILAGFHERGIPVYPRVGERRCWLPLGELLTDGQQREWSFLLECWCLYNELEMRPWSGPAQIDTAGASGRQGSRSTGMPAGMEVALTPAQILAFLDWAMTVARHEKPGDVPVTSQLARLRAFLMDDVNPGDEIRVLAAP